jgi:hypothetical protein
MRRAFLLIMLFVPLSNAYGIQEICVRDFGEVVCERGIGFKYVETLNGEVICARSLSDNLCKNAGGENIYHVYGQDRELVCTPDYNSPQTPYCAAKPETYKWVALAFPDGDLD